MKISHFTHVVLSVLLLAVMPRVAACQQIQFVGRGEFATDALIRRALRAGATLILTRDTLIARNDTVPGSVLAAGVTLRLEGVIRGDLFAVDANLFLRPGSHITGNVTSIAAGYFPSDRAVVSGTVVDLPDAPYDVVLTPQGARIIGTRRPAVLDLDGVAGLRLPTYDRVDGVTLGVGASYYVQQFGSVEPMLRAQAGFSTRREAWKARLEGVLLSRFVDFGLGAERVTATQDSWIRSDFHNTITFLFFAHDYRNYYRADRAWAGFTVHAAAGFDLLLNAQIEEDVSLSGGDPWTLFRIDSLRPNPSIEEGRIASAELGVRGSWAGLHSMANLDARAELARRTARGDFHFARYELDARYAMAGLSNHTLEIQGHAQGPLPGTDDLPQQRWGILGGDGTLETFDVGSVRGDRVAFVRSTYHVPLDPLHVTGLGYPAIELIHAAGNAWLRGGDTSLHQSLGIRLRFTLLYGGVFFDPDDPDDPRFHIGLAIRRRPPWEENPSDGR